MKLCRPPEFVMDPDYILFTSFLAQSGSQSRPSEICIKDYWRYTEYSFTRFGKANDQVGISGNDKEQGIFTVT